MSVGMLDTVIKRDLQPVTIKVDENACDVCGRDVRAKDSNIPVRPDPDGIIRCTSCRNRRGAVAYVFDENDPCCDD
jgi:hypothetical protein